MKRVISHSFHFTRRLLKVLIVLVALLILSARGLTYYVQNHASDIVGKLSVVLGVPVEVDSVDAEWRGLSPLVHLQGVRIGEAEQLFSIDSVAVKPDVMASLKEWTIAWSRFDATGVDIHLQELASGSWSFAGMSLGGDGYSRGGASYIEAMILESNRVSITDSYIHVTTLRGTEFDIELDALALNYALSFRRLTLDATLGSPENKLNLIAELSGDAARFFDLEGRAYASIEAQNLDGFMTELIGRLKTDELVQIDSGTNMQAQFWANLNVGEQITFQGDIEITDIPKSIFGFECADLCANEFATAGTGVYGRYSPLIQSLDFLSPEIHIGGDLIESPDFRVTRALKTSEVDYSLQLPSLDLAELWSSIQKFPLPETSLIDNIFALDASGEVSFISIDLPNFDPSRFRVSGRVTGLDIGSYRGAPAAKNINADFIVDKEGGLVRAEGTAASMYFPKIYAHWFDYDDYATTVSWRVDEELARVLVSSDNAVVTMPQGRVHGAFRVDAPITPGQPEGVDLTLALAMRDGRIEDHPTFIPDSLPEETASWLNSALISGDIAQAAVLYRGSVRLGESSKRSVQIRASALDGELAFLDRWPRLTQVDTNLWLSNDRVRALSSSANILDLSLLSSEVILQADTSQTETQSEIGVYSESETISDIKPDIKLTLSADVQGKSESLMDLLRTTTVRDALGDSLDDIELSGPISGKAEFSVPIKEQLSREEIDINLRLDMDDNALSLAPYDLHIADLSGQIRMDSNGLKIEPLNGLLWEKPIDLKVSENLENGSLNIDLVGELDMSALQAWLDISVPSNRFTGATLVEGRIELLTNRIAGLSYRPDSYHFWTDLVGVEIELPPPFLKQPEQRRELNLLFEVGEFMQTTGRLLLDDSTRENSGAGFSLLLPSKDSSYDPADSLESAIPAVSVERISSGMSPMGASSNELVLQMIHTRGDQQRSFSAAAASLAMTNDQTGGAVVSPQMEAGEFLVNIVLDELDIEDWLFLSDLYDDEESSSDNSVANSAELLGLNPFVKANLNNIKYGEMDFGSLLLGIGALEAGWKIDFETSYTSGIYLTDGDQIEVSETNELLEATKFSESNSEILEASLASAADGVTSNPLAPANSSRPHLTISNLDIDLLKAQISPDLEENDEAENSEQIGPNGLMGENDQESSAESLELDPRQIPGLSFEIQSILLGDQERGQWSGIAEPNQSGLLISDLRGGFGSLQFAEEDYGSNLFWGVDEEGDYTELNLTFDYADIADLFYLSGAEPAMSSEKGVLYGSLNWRGAPHQFSIGAVSGIMGLSAEDGAFNTSSEDVPNALLKMIGLFNVSSWSRRLKFDFSDVSADGTPYDKVVGDFIVGEGVVSTLTPVSVDLSSGDMFFDGEIDLNTEQLDARLVLTLPARQNITWIAALVGGLPAAAGVWLAGQVFDDELDSLSSVSYRIDGTLDEPQVSADKIFESTIKN